MHASQEVWSFLPRGVVGGDEGSTGGASEEVDGAVAASVDDAAAADVDDVAAADVVASSIGLR